MPRARNIKPAFFTNPELSECTIAARLLFIGLWTLCDRDGRMLFRPKFIKMSIFPADEVNVSNLLDELTYHKLILIYNTNGKDVLFVPGFMKHQNPHPNETASIFPPHPDYVIDSTKLITLHEPSHHVTSTRAESLILNPEPPYPPSGGGRFNEVVESFQKLEGATCDVNRAEKIWRSKKLDENADKIITAIEHYAFTPQWQRGAIPTLANFLADGSWKILPKLPYGAKSGIR